MSHSLHRFGPHEHLEKDYCIYARAAKGINRDNCGDKLRKIFDIFLSEDYVNFGHGQAGKSFADGLDPAEYMKAMDSSYGIIVNFGSKEAVMRVLQKLKDADTGISIVVSGLIDEVVDVCAESGLTPHTASLSLGIYGDQTLVPEDEVLELTTMCGHSLIGNTLARSAILDVKAGKMSPEEAALLIARPCVCGIFNTKRCQEQLAELL